MRLDLQTQGVILFTPFLIVGAGVGPAAHVPGVPARDAWLIDISAIFACLVPGLVLLVIANAARAAPGPWRVVLALLAVGVRVVLTAAIAMLFWRQDDPVLRAHPRAFVVALGVWALVYLVIETVILLGLARDPDPQDVRSGER